MIIKLLVEGGNMTPGPALSQKIGPLGINMGKVISGINEATASFKGLKVPVELDVDTKTKNFTIKVSSPPVSGLLKKEAGLEKGTPGKGVKVANLAIEQIIKIAKTKQHNMLDKELKSAIKTVLGSCVSLGILVESKEAKEVSEEIDKGDYDSEINSEKTEVNPEKKKQLDDYFSDLNARQQEAAKKAEEEAAAAEEAKSEEEKSGSAEKVEGVEKKEGTPEKK